MLQLNLKKLSWSLVCALAFSQLVACVKISGSTQFLVQGQITGNLSVFAVSNVELCSVYNYVARSKGRVLNAGSGRRCEPISPDANGKYTVSMGLLVSDFSIGTTTPDEVEIKSASIFLQRLTNQYQWTGGNIRSFRTAPSNIEAEADFDICWKD